MKSDRNIAIIGIIVTNGCESIYAGSIGDYIKHSGLTYMSPKLWMQYNAEILSGTCKIPEAVVTRSNISIMMTVRNVHVYENWSNKYTDITHMGCIWKKQYIYNNSIYIY